MSDDDDRPIEDEAVRAALAELTAWEPLRRSAQLSAFLTYVVEETLAGRADAIKAYAIAVDVLGRSEDFDAQSDPIVRVQARRLRGLLDEFDRTGLGRAPARILLPVGRYVPEFVPRADAEAPETEPEIDLAVAPAAGPPRTLWLLGGAAFLIALAALYYWPYLGLRMGPGPPAQPRMPLVIVEEFENLVGDQAGPPLTAGLAVDLVTNIDAFPDLAARYGGGHAVAGADDLFESDAVYVLSGLVRAVPEGLLYSVLVRDAATAAIVLDLEVPVAVSDGVPEMNVAAVSRRLALALGDPRGPLHERARIVIANWRGGGVLDSYPCRVAFAFFRQQRTERDAHMLEACLGAALGQGDAQAGAALAVLKAKAGYQAGLHSPAGAALLAEARALAEAAVAADPLSAFVWAQQGHVLALAGEMADARERLSAAMQLNPAMVDLLADYAFVEALTGNWDTANRLADDTLWAVGRPPGFYYAAPALSAFYATDYHRAVDLARRMGEDWPDIAAVLGAAAGGHLNAPDIVNPFLPRLLVSERFRHAGILPVLRANVADAALVKDIASGLIKAGLPLDRLVEPF